MARPASGLGPEAVEDQILRLTSAGYLDDAEFARAWIDDRIRLRHYGRQRIASELVAHGVDPAYFSSQLDEVCGEEQELARAISLLGTKYRPVAARNPRTDIHRAYQWLLRRGFSNGVARRAANGLGERNGSSSAECSGGTFLDTPDGGRYDDVGK